MVWGEGEERNMSQEIHSTQLVRFCQPGHLQFLPAITVKRNHTSASCPARDLL